jgi:hypothetical protein
MNKKRSPLPWLIAVVMIAAAVAAAWYFGREGDAPMTRIPPAAESPVVETTTGPRHPIEQVQPTTPGETVELPPLQQSDAAFGTALSGLIGGSDPLALVNPQYPIQRFVATVDNLPRARLAPQVRPLKPAPGEFRPVERDGRLWLDERNYARYTRYIALVEAVDTDAAVALYVRWYPLFQQAYRELGYPDAHFNDRLVEVVDHLRAAPEVEGPVELVPYKGEFAFADPGLEGHSSGHKLMVRIGPANAARVKAKLGELRAALAGQSLPEPPAEQGQSEAGE